MSGTHLIIREAARKLLLDVTFAPPDRIDINRERLLRNGVEVLVRPQNILITNNSMVVSRCTADNVPGGLILGYHQSPLPGFMTIENIPRYLGDKRQALAFERECFKRDDQN